jgi:hypothetical protein
MPKLKEGLAEMIKEERRQQILKTAPDTYCVYKDGQHIEGIRHINEARALAKKICGKVWVTSEEDGEICHCYQDNPTSWTRKNT